MIDKIRRVTKRSHDNSAAMMQRGRYPQTSDCTSHVDDGDKARKRGAVLFLDISSFVFLLLLKLTNPLSYLHVILSQGLLSLTCIYIIWMWIRPNDIQTMTIFNSLYLIEVIFKIFDFEIIIILPISLLC